MTLGEFAISAQAWTFGLTCLVGLVQGLVLWGLWSLRKTFVTTKQCGECRLACRKEVDGRLNKQDARAGELHDKVSQAAPREEAAELAKQVEVVRGTINTLRATVEGLGELLARAERQLNLLMEHHLGGTR